MTYAKFNCPRCGLPGNPAVVHQCARKPRPTYRALSLRQPWAWLILHAGKDVENRSWLWRGQLPRRIFLHASKAYDEREYEDAFEAALYLKPDLVVPERSTWATAIPRGGIVGAVTVLGVQQNGKPRQSPWSSLDGVGYLLGDPRPLPFCEIRGEKGFFGVDQVVVDQIARMMRPE